MGSIADRGDAAGGTHGGRTRRNGRKPSCRTPLPKLRHPSPIRLSISARAARPGKSGRRKDPPSRRTSPSCSSARSFLLIASRVTPSNCARSVCENRRVKRADGPSISAWLWARSKSRRARRASRPEKAKPPIVSTLRRRIVHSDRNQVPRDGRIGGKRVLHRSHRKQQTARCLQGRGRRRPGQTVKQRDLSERVTRLGKMQRKLPPVPVRDPQAHLPGNSPPLDRRPCRLLRKSRCPGG